ncbi:MAG: fibronectin type III domain-containing protein, partial [Verrucomicrobiota bacterium]
AGTEAGLAAYYTFEDGTARDLTGNGHAGELFGPTFRSEEPAPAPFASFDPAQGMTLDAGGEIQNWVSVEGNLTLSPSDAATSPTLETEGINGHPALAFDGVDDYLLLPNLEGFNLGGPFDAKVFTIVFQTGGDVTNRQLLYEQGGAIRGLNLFIEAGQLSYSAWNKEEAAWGPLAVTTSVAPATTYVATLMLDAVAGTLTGYLNSQSIGTLSGVKLLYAHSDGGGLGNNNSYTLFPDGSRTTGAFGGKVAFWSTYNTLLTTAERNQLEQALMTQYLDTGSPLPPAAPTGLSLSVLNENEVTIRWSDNSDNETGFEVERSSGDGQPFERIATVPADTVGYEDKALPYGTLIYRVTAVNSTHRTSSEPEKIEVLFNKPEPPLADLNEALEHEPAYNGNISGLRWKGPDDEEEQVYFFGYDGLNRLKKAHYAAGQSSAYTSNRGYFSVPDVDYDLNGNILHLTRQGLNANHIPDVIDNLSYTYEGNQLHRVSDTRGSAGFKDGSHSGDDYAYDANSNMTKDLNKGITHIEYNHLNLPTRVEWANGQVQETLYDASGMKLQTRDYKADTLHQTIDYVEEFVYVTEGSGQRALQLIQHEEGRLVPNESEGTFDFQYHITDHLGNVRVTFSTTPENYEMAEDFESGEDNGFRDLHRYTNINANTTSGGDEVALLQAGETGAMIFLSVDKRDTIDLTVNANYERAPTGNAFLGTAYDALFSSFDAAYGSG